MMLTVNAEEFRALSASCQQELLELLLGKDGVDAFLKGIVANRVPDSNLEEVPDGEPSVDDVMGTTRAIDLTPEQAGNLVARLAEESVDTLKLFASGKAVAISELLSSNPSSYKNVSDLNRKFVGAVNRALRTVTQVKGKAKDRSSVLLIPADDKRTGLEAPDLLEKCIKVKPLTAVALREAFQLPEPLPDASYFRIEGDTANPLSVQADQTQLLASMLAKSWKNFAGRPNAGRCEYSVLQVAAHFHKYGFKIFLGEECGWVGVPEDTEEEMWCPPDSVFKLAPMPMPGILEGEDLREYFRTHWSLMLFVAHERAPAVAACFDHLSWV